ncbi:hypothetical protein E0Z10_g1187 [Xylaria hypoxylon]|uniref:Uncharacterized protein n=1 Tax=Xylaria hypoxylon TaxID=37992 RepID=A0A4Z0Z7R0_9PEZI|nr:hypothetical protein E0Z10_g1187 [Xylaria hypoxylon]
MAGTTEYTHEQISFVLDICMKAILQGQYSRVYGQIITEFKNRYGVEDFGAAEVRSITVKSRSDPRYSGRWKNALEVYSRIQPTMNAFGKPLRIKLSAKQQKMQEICNTANRKLGISPIIHAREMAPSPEQQQNKHNSAGSQAKSGYSTAAVMSRQEQVSGTTRINVETISRSEESVYEPHSGRLLQPRRSVFSPSDNARSHKTNVLHEWLARESNVYVPDFSPINMFTGKPFKNPATPAFKRANISQEGYQRAAKRAKVDIENEASTFDSRNREWDPSSLSYASLNNGYPSHGDYRAAMPTSMDPAAHGLNNPDQYSQFGPRKASSECEIYDISTPGVPVLLHKPDTATPDTVGSQSQD